MPGSTLTAPPAPAPDRLSADVARRGDNGQLTLTETHLRAMLDNIPAAIALVDRQGRHCYVNEAYWIYVGKPPEEILGRTIREILGHETYARMRPDPEQRLLFERALAGEVTRWEGWLGYPEGLRYVNRLYYPYRNEAGEVEGVFGYTRDLTDLKQSEARNAAITAASLDCIIVFDDAGLVVEFNPAAERTFGLDRVVAIGRPIRSMFEVPTPGAAALFGQRTEVEATRADGRRFPAELAISEVRLPARQLFTAYLRDLTAVRAAEEQIERQREALHQSEKMAAFGSLLAGVAHELNNPLSIVIGNAMMLADEAAESAPSLAARTQRIQAAAERCGRIIRSFLAMARQRRTQMRPAQVSALVDSALELLAYSLRTSGVLVERDIPPDLPPVPCDADQINQVLSNLLVNARQVLEGGPQPRRVRISADADDDWVRIAVADNGPGVSQDIRSRVFDPYFTTKPTGAGTGIGLAVSRGIVEAHGGTLLLEERAEGGACFVVLLPRRAVVDEAASASAPSPAAPRRQSALILDDEPEIGAILAELLAAQGYDSEVVERGQAALARLAARDYDLILCDVRLPDLDGPAVFDWMATHRPHLCGRTGFITGDTLGQAAGGFLARCARPVLEKPFSTTALRRLVAEIRIASGTA